MQKKAVRSRTRLSDCAPLGLHYTFVYQLEEFYVVVVIGIVFEVNVLADGLLVDDALALHRVTLLEGLEVVSLVVAEDADGVVVELGVDVVELCDDFEHYLLKEVVILHLLHRRFDFAAEVEAQLGIVGEYLLNLLVVVLDGE